MLRNCFIASQIATAFLLAVLGIVSLFHRDIGHSGKLARSFWSAAYVQNGFLRAHVATASQSKTARSQSNLSLGPLGKLSWWHGSGRGWNWTTVSMPVWVPVVLLVIHPTAALIRGPLRRRRRRRRGQCERCGYDLTGNTSGICSECGQCVRRATEDDVS